VSDGGFVANASDSNEKSRGISNAHGGQTSPQVERREEAPFTRKHQEDRFVGPGAQERVQTRSREEESAGRRSKSPKDRHGCGFEEEENDETCEPGRGGEACPIGQSDQGREEGCEASSGQEGARAKDRSEEGGSQQGRQEALRDQEARKQAHGGEAREEKDRQEAP
jgi:hypothetical protein